ncbi:uncharacterized protein [Eucyclogobius newberryi]|uniref:uncharacterized protein n=1 Tax=Eucyclogobius newberryi TaxID=166745 RepID=UPI003B58B51E
MDYTCITHISSVEKEPTQPLTVVRWRKLVTCAQKWIEIDGIDRALAAAVCVHDDDFAKQNYPTSSVASSDENLAHLLERSLVKAAESRADESILMCTRGKDCVANEVRYHKRCYKEYTSFLTKKTSDERLPKVWEYGDAYKAFCDTVIRARLIENQEILRMKKLSSLFQKFIKKHPGHGSYRTDLLKKRLQRDFPQLNFHKPPRRNLSEMVSTGTTGLLHQDFSTETHMSVSGETSSSDGEMVPESGKDAALRELSRTIYSAGILLKQVVKSAPSMDPTSEDLNVSSARKIVPV